MIPDELISLDFLYRGDSRSPELIFREGSRPRGTNRDLLAAVRYPELRGDSEYVATSIEYHRAQSLYARSGYLYVIDRRVLDRCGTVLLDVKQELGRESPHHDRELEMAARYGIPACAIAGAIQVDRDGYLAGAFTHNQHYTP